MENSAGQEWYIKSSFQNKAIGTKTNCLSNMFVWHIAQHSGVWLPCQLGTICLPSQPDYNQLCGGNFLSHRVMLSVNAIFHYHIQYCQDTLSLWNIAESHHGKLIEVLWIFKIYLNNPTCEWWNIKNELVVQYDEVAILVQMKYTDIWFMSELNLFNESVHLVHWKY